MFGRLEELTILQTPLVVGPYESSPIGKNRQPPRVDLIMPPMPEGNDAGAKPNPIPGPLKLIHGLHVPNRWGDACEMLVAAELKRAGQGIPLDGGHCVVNNGSDLRLWCVGPQVRPSCFLRHPKDACRSIFVWVFRVGTLIPLCFEFSMFRFEGIGDVLQENEAKDDVLVLRCVHVVAERICHAPQLRFIDTDDADVTHLTTFG